MIDIKNVIEFDKEDTQSKILKNLFVKKNFFYLFDFFYLEFKDMYSDLIEIKK
jgi:hypothetical protein